MVPLLPQVNPPMSVFMLLLSASSVAELSKPWGKALHPDVLPLM